MSGWRKGKPTSGQLAVIATINEELGTDFEPKTKGEASDIIKDYKNGEIGGYNNE